MPREFDRPAHRWPWIAVPFAGALMGGLAAFGVVGTTWISDPDVFVEHGTPTDWYPSDASVLSTTAVFVVPAAALVGAVVGALVFSVAILIREAHDGYTIAVLTGAVLAAIAGGLGAAPLSAFLAAPPGTTLLVTAAAGFTGLLLTALALRAREPSTSPSSWLPGRRSCAQNDIR